MDRWQYRMVLGACLLLTAPLEWLGTGVYRRARRIVLAVAPVAAVFVVWDVVAIAAGVWTYNPRYVSGLKLPGALPLEELLFFLVIPLCGLFTYAAVDGVLSRSRRLRDRAGRSS
jgi:lycopene cyclase domain-containing protein